MSTRRGRPTVRQKSLDAESSSTRVQTHTALEDGQWWLVAREESQQLAERIRTLLERTWRRQEFLRSEMATSWRLYENSPISGLTPRLYRPRVATTRINRISWNLIKSVVDTYVSLIVKEQPKVTFVTSGGSRTLQRKAALLTKFNDGVLYENKMHRTTIQIVRDSALFGQGIVKVYADLSNKKKPKIVIERMLPWDDHTDEQDADMGDPQSKQFTYWVDKFALAREYPEKAAEIIRANSDAFTDASVAPYQSGQNAFVLLTESWHLPRVPGSKKNGGSGDGRHVISVGSVVLVDEGWTRGDFGLVTLYRQRPVKGIWGTSLPQELAALQVEIAKLLHNISLAQRRAVGHWLVENNSEINTNAVDDRVGSIFRYTGQPPTYQAFDTVASDVYNHLNTLWQRGFEMVGVSANMAASERPAGLNSGKAQLVYADIQAERFEPCYKEYQQFYVDLARTIIAVAREISEEVGENWGVKAISKREMLSTVKWADAHLEDEEFNVEMFATRALADDPAARLAMVQEMMNSGLIDQDTGKRLMEMPDIEESNSYEFAPYNFVMKQLDAILDGESIEENAPDPMLEDFLPQAKIIGAKVYLKSRLDNVEEDRLIEVSKWIELVKSLIANSQQPPANQNGAPAGAPGAPPPPDGSPDAPIADEVQARLQSQEARAAATQLKAS